jgi:rhodanese-related sulfurtransferase
MIDNSPPMIASELLARISTGTAPTVVDVRTRTEFARGHVPGAVNIPLWKVLSGAPSIAMSLDDPLVVYCGHGPRAWLAGAALRRRGFRRVEYLDGHMSQWRRAGLREET